MSESTQLAQYDRHRPERLLIALTRPHSTGFFDNEREAAWHLIEESPLVCHTRIMQSAYDAFQLHGSTSPLSNAWEGLESNRRGRRWKRRFRDRCPLFARTLDRLEEEGA